MLEFASRSVSSGMLSPVKVAKVPRVKPHRVHRLLTDISRSGLEKGPGARLMLYLLVASDLTTANDPYHPIDMVPKYWQRGKRRITSWAKTAGKSVVRTGFLKSLSYIFIYHYHSLSFHLKPRH